MIAEDYLSRSYLFRRLRCGPDKQLVELYAACLVKDGFGRRTMWRSLNLLGNLIGWIASIGSKEQRRHRSHHTSR